VPPVFSTDPAQTPEVDAQLLGQLNVRYVAAAFDLSAPGLSLVQQFGPTRVYENQYARPRAWLDGGSAVVQAWSPDRILINAVGPGTLVLSEVDYPGWQAWVGAQPVPIATVDGLLRSVPLGPGASQVVFEYRPLSLYLGALFTLVGIAAVIILCLRKP
jgi:hypothetical protein